MPSGILTLRAWWSHRQSLDGSLTGSSPAEVLARTGWAGTTREAADAAVANVEIHELPAARGCTYVVPAQDYGVALRAGQPFREPDMNAARKLGVTDSELDGIASLRGDAAILSDSCIGNAQKGMIELPNHAILERGTLTGLWDCDPSAQAIVWKSFIPKNAEMEKAVNRTEDFVRQELGDARSFSLDSSKARISRMNALR